MLRQVAQRGLLQLRGPLARDASCRARAFAAEPAVKTVVQVKDDAEFAAHMKEIADTGKVGVVDFSAAWCAPCRTIEPIYEQYSKQYKQVKFLKVDIDSSKLHKTVTDHEITGVPSFFIYKGSKRIESFTGARPDVLQKLLQQHSGDM